MSARPPQPHQPLPQNRPDCRVAAQAHCYGAIETSVVAVAGAVARPGQAHIAIRYGRVLIYVEDHAALASLAGAVRQALEMAEAVFGPIEDAFTEAEREARQRFERTGNATALR